jgi:hypothetical protein
MTRPLTIAVLFAAWTLSSAAAAQTPAIYSGVEAVAASAKLCERGCTIVPQPKLIRVATAKPRAVAAPIGADGMEALARRQLDALLAELD